MDWRPFFLGDTGHIRAPIADNHHHPGQAWVDEPPAFSRNAPSRRMKHHPLHQPRAWALAVLLMGLLGGCEAVAGSTAAGPGCDAKQAGIVHEAFSLAERRTAAAIAFLDASPSHPHVQTWFGTAPPGKVRARFVLVLERLRANRRPPWSCATAEQCGNRPVFAIASLNRGSIMLCPMFFNTRNEGGDSRPGTLVHEVSHIAAGTSDVAYGRTAAQRLAAKQPDSAAINADNLEYFVEFLPTP